MKNRINIITLLIAFSLAFTCLTTTAFAVEATPNDSVALGDLTEGKILFDINLSDATKLPLYLNVIQQTYDGLEAQGVTPDFVIAFRGYAVTFITNAAADVADTAAADAVATGTDAAVASAMFEVRSKIVALSSLPNVRLEACAVATGLFGVDNDEILAEITVVGNTFISAAGFGSSTKGYATIPIM